MISWPRPRCASWATRLPIVPLRDEQAGLLAEQLGGALLERDDGRVVAEDVVADLGLGHRAAHGGRRAGDGVAAQVDRAVGMSVMEASIGRRRARPAGRGDNCTGAHLLSSALAATDPWCSGPTCQPVTLEIAGSNPVGSAITASSYAPSARPDGAFFLPGRARAAPVDSRPGRPGRLPPVRRLPSDGHRPRRARRRRARSRSALGWARAAAEPVAADRRGRRAATSPRPSADRRRRPPRASHRRRIAVAGARRRASAATPAPPLAAPTSRSCRSPSSGRRRPAATATTSPRSSPGRDALRRPSSSSTPRRTRSSPRSASTGRPTRPRSSWPPDAATLTTDLAENRKRLAFLRADAVGPARPGARLGRARRCSASGAVKTVADWGLTARLPQRAGTPAFDPAQAVDARRRRRHPARPRRRPDDQDQGQGRRLPVRRRHRRHHRRATAARRSAGTCRTTQRTGNAGAMRDLIKGADIAIANFENPAPNTFRYHTSGTVFSADPKLHQGPRRTPASTGSAIANNHIRDAGGDGILQTIANLEEVRDRVERRRQEPRGGAQAGDPRGRRDQGRVPRLRHDRQGLTARAPTEPAAPDVGRRVKADVAAARKAGAEVVIVFPHWGTEYDPTPFGGQQKLARRRDRRRRRPRHRQPRPLGGRDGGLRRASRSGTRSATSSSTRRGPSRRWRA